MRRTDIKVGEEYRLLVGTKGGEEAKRSTWGENYRCIVMNTTQDFTNSTDRGNRDSLWHAQDQAKRMGRAFNKPRSVYATRRRSNASSRIFVAVEIPVRESRVVETITPDEYRALRYNESYDYRPVKDENGDVMAWERTEWFVAENVWLPFAPLVKDIIQPWADFEATKAEEAERARLSEIASEKTRVLQEAESARKRAEAEEQTKQNQRRQAASKERYEVRTLPTLIEILGEEPSFRAEWHDGSVATVTLTLEQAEQLVNTINYLNERKDP